MENLVGYARRNFPQVRTFRLTPVPQADTWEALNAKLLARCRAEVARRLRGEIKTIGELWAEEKGVLLPLSSHLYECCRLLRLQTQLMKQDLIVLDEVGFVPFSPEGSQLLFQFCSERYLRGSVIFTTNLEFPRWTEVFGDPQLTGALLDRITH